METRLEEVHEEIEHLVELPPSRLKVVATLAVILVTLVTTLAAILAASAASSESVAQRDRQLSLAQAEVAELQASLSTRAANQQHDDGREAGWRAAFLRVEAAQATDPSVVAQLRAQATVAQSQAKAIEAALPAPPGSPLDAHIAALQIPVTVADQTADARGQQSAGWLRNEDRYLSTISMLAVALFLLGLALTLSNRSTAKGFVVLALALLVVSGGRLAYIAAGSPQAPSAARRCATTSLKASTAICDYAQGLNATNNDQAVKLLGAAVQASPRYPAAWEALGDAESNVGTRPSLARAERDYDQALELGFPEAAIVYNNVGYAQLLEGHLAASAASLDKALALDPRDEVTLASLAEERLAAHDLPGAKRWLDRALAIVSGYGPRFRNGGSNGASGYFSAFRLDELNLADPGGVPQSMLAPFFTEVRDAEASLDALGSDQPGDAHGATVSGIVLRQADEPLGQAGSATLGFSYAGLRAGDIVSLRFYADDINYELAASNNAVQVGANQPIHPGAGTFAPGQYIVPLPAGAQSLEIYLNGRLLGSSSFTMPAGSVS